MKQKGFTLWFTGLSGAGKTTLSNAVEKELRRLELNVEHLDGDIVRKYLSRDLGFTKEDRGKNIERVTFVASLLTKYGVATLVSFISPYREKREEAREMIGNFVEVYVKCPLEVCEERDVKGLYEKARKGEIDYFTGITDPYEEPENADVVVDTNELNETQCAEAVLDHLEKAGYIDRALDWKTLME
ncbi:MAG: adenylyl-sulfate kinase [Verrucomicrobia bacterium]|nr:adenylyl-sulfate kinase [Verrucomicrobiota bacterium]MDA1087712.1 adenylyl-sulfate kinase [Verrucomicrobiota bacterium]